MNTQDNIIPPNTQDKKTGVPPFWNFFGFEKTQKLESFHKGQVLSCRHLPHAGPGLGGTFHGWCGCGTFHGGGTFHGLWHFFPGGGFGPHLVDDWQGVASRGANQRSGRAWTTWSSTYFAPFSKTAKQLTPTRWFWTCSPNQYHGPSQVIFTHNCAKLLLRMIPGKYDCEGTFSVPGELSETLDGSLIALQWYSGWLITTDVPGSKSVPCCLSSEDLNQNWLSRSWAKTWWSVSESLC